MAEFETEELRRIFQNLADRLANTKGDDNIVEKLKAVEDAIKRLDENSKNADKKDRVQAKKNNEELADELVKRLDQLSIFQKINENLEDLAESGMGAGPNQGPLNDIPAKELKSFGSALGGSLLNIGKFSDTIVNSSLTFAKNMGKLDGTIGGFMHSVGLGNTALGTFGAMVDENVGAFQTLIGSAEGTIGSIDELRQAMSTSALGAQEFADAIAKGTQGTRLMGAQPWAQLYKTVKDQSRSLGYYGMTMQQMVDAQNSYLDMMSNQGGLMQNRSEEEMAKGIKDLIESSNEIAYIMGQTRDEALKAQQRAAQDANASVFAQGQGWDQNSEQAKAYNKALAMTESIPELNAMLKNGILNEGNIRGESAVVLANMPPEFQRSVVELTREINKGTLTEDEVNTRIQALGALLHENTEQSRLGHKQAAQLAQDSEQFAARNRMVQGLQKIKQGDVQKADTGNNITDQLTKGLLKVEETLRQFAAGFQDILTELIWDPMKRFGEFINGSVIEGAAGFVQWFRDSISWLGGFENALLAVSGLLAGGALVGGAATMAAKFIGGIFFSAVAGLAKAILSPIGSLTKGIFDLTKFLTTSLFKGLSSVITNALKLLPSLAGPAANLASKAGPAGMAVGAALVGAEVGNQIADKGAELVRENISQESKDAWASFRKKTEGFWDMFNTNILSGQIEAGPNQGKNYWSGKQEKKKKNGEWVDLTEDEKAGKVAIDEDKRDKNGAYVTRDGADPVEEKKDDKPIEVAPVKVENLPEEKEQKPVEVAPVKVEPPPEPKDKPEDKISENVQSQTEAMKAQQAIMQGMMPNISEIQKQALQVATNDVKEPQAQTIANQTQLDTAAIIAALTSGQTQNDATLKAMVSLLSQIHQAIRSSADFEKDSSQIIRDRLADLNKINEDIARLSRK